ncbi:hypothetical protein ACLI1A_06385 [Flavobacterium sp. RHBU_3]|uniref:hypothetical protein n=1 Tax=Flavobacterium sp. RHBU_3 TaxID=3391184 RepID=UPI0039855316
MKAIRILFTLLLFIASISCKQEKHLETSSNTTIVKQDTPTKPARPKVQEKPKQKLKEPEKDFIKIEDLHTYAVNAPTIEQPKNMGNPFGALKFDKVIAYDYEGIEVMHPSIIEKGDFCPVVLKQQVLTTKQVDKLIKCFTNPSTYGEESAACYQPHLGFVFFNNSKIVLTIDICLHCNKMNSSAIIPAQKTFAVNEGTADEYYAEGFSAKGRKEIATFCKEIKFMYGTDSFIKELERMNY